MNKKFELTQEDKADFANAMRGVTRLKQTPYLSSPPSVIKLSSTKSLSHRAISGQKHRDSLLEDSLLFEFSDHETLPPVTSQDRIAFFRSGLQQKQIRKIRSGSFPIELTLDLHNQTVEQARTLLSQTLAQCRENQLRHLLIIHGKGRGLSPPILKNKLNHWLRQCNGILAFCSVLEKNGGSGAVYVLLSS